ncbi:MAG: agmatine deiminase family protein [Muribaculaceae bacterium]|nr:agmatine deiminase family protein [Muribaculaceae bacterium]
MKNETVRTPAEWEPVDAVIVAWPHAETDWNYMLAEVQACYSAIIKALAEVTEVIVVGPEAPTLADGTRTERVHYVSLPTNDTWTRDYGPIATTEAPYADGAEPCANTSAAVHAGSEDNSDSSASAASDGLRLNDFCFNAWGLKFAANCDNLVNSRLAAKGLFSVPVNNRLGFVLEGGSIESDGCGTILTTASCLLSPNRNGDLSREQVEDHLAAYLGARRVLWLEHGALSGDDTDGHIDTLARLVPPGDTIMYVGADPSHPDYEELAAMKEELMALRREDGMPYNLVELPLPPAMHDPDDDSLLPATYANFLIVNGTVFLPTYGNPLADTTAVMSVKAAIPEYEVVCIDCRALVRQHGSLHCATMQLPRGSFAAAHEQV